MRIDRAAARLDDNADQLITFVANIGENRQLLVIDQRRQRFDQLALLHAIGNLGHHRDPCPATKILDCPFRADAEAAAPRRISLRNCRWWIDNQPTRRQIRPLHIVEQGHIISFGLVDQMNRRIDHFGGVVRRNVRRHPHGNPARAIGEQIGEQPRHDFGLFVFPVICGAIVDRAVVKPRHQVDGNRRQPRFGIAIRRGIVAVDIAEIALSVDQWITQRECLREADHRVINRLVAMRMIFADNIADNARALLVATRRIELEQAHRPEQAAVDRLQPVAQIGERPCGDRRHRINEITIRQRAIERRIDDVVERVCEVGGHMRRLAAKIHRGERLRKRKRPDCLRAIRPNKAKGATRWRQA